MKAETGGRERVLIEARRLFLDRGYAEVSMQQIADAVGMTKAALYYHFRDKDDLFASVVVREMSQQRKSIEREIERDDSLDHTVERIARLYFDQLSPDSLRMMTDFKQHVPESRHEEVHAELENFVNSIATLFNRAAERNEIRDIQPRMAAFLFFHTLVGYLINSVRDPQITPPSDPESAARLVASVVLHGIAAPQSRQTIAGDARYHEPVAATGGDTD